MNAKHLTDTSWRLVVAVDLEINVTPILSYRDWDSTGFLRRSRYMLANAFSAFIRPQVIYKCIYQFPIISSNQLGPNGIILPFSNFAGNYTPFDYRSGSTVTALEAIAERESIYRVLAQTTPENTSKDYTSYTCDPHTRYPTLNTKVNIHSQ